MCKQEGGNSHPLSVSFSSLLAIFFSSLIAGKHLQHLVQTDRVGGGRGWWCLQHKQPQTCFLMWHHHHHLRPAWKQIHQLGCRWQHAATMLKWHSLDLLVPVLQSNQHSIHSCTALNKEIHSRPAEHQEDSEARWMAQILHHSEKETFSRGRIT